MSAVVLVGVGATATSTSSSAATPSARQLARGVAAEQHSSAEQHAALLRLAKAANSSKRAEPRIARSSKASVPTGVPAKGRYGFLLELDHRSTMSVYNRSRPKGAAAAASAAKRQFATVRVAQKRVVAALPRKSTVLYRTHAVLAGVAVSTDVHNYAALRALPGVSAVYPIVPKTVSNSYAVPLQGAPQAWTAYGDLGQNSTIGVIDSGIDYTHANFGGPGTVAAYNTAHAAEATAANPALFPNSKVIGGYDFAGDKYDATPTDPTYDPVPHPDPNPLDCNTGSIEGHGSHVAGTAAGLGENQDGSTYTGAYNSSTPFDTMKIGPGMAPEAKIYSFRVFGCSGSTDLIGAAIDRAADPNGDGSTSDHVDVINMSLGSDFASPQEGDAVQSNAASALGISVVAAAGNANDVYDVGGAPADATRAIAVAATSDAYNLLDGVTVQLGSAAPVTYGQTPAILYDFATKPGLAGAVIAPLADKTACAPFSAADKARLNGKVAFIEWSQAAVDAGTDCGSISRGANLVAAGAKGFILADDVEDFGNNAINGSDTIPSVLVVKSGGDAIRAALAANTVVAVIGTSTSSVKQLLPSLNDQITTFSSRGIGDAGDVKPDVSAVGLTVTSTKVGTGTGSLTISGTSMATPMVAGLSALVRSQHPQWTPEQVKADIMNTAGQDVYADGNHTGPVEAPNRAGTGRIQAKPALDNDVLAYVANDPGAVSVSFGPQAVTAAKKLTKTIKVENTGLSTRTYAVSYTARTSVPGAVYSVSPNSVRLDPRSTKNVTVTLSLDPGKMTKTIDSSVDPEQLDLPREFKADASGLVVLTGSGVPTLRVPVYSAPRPASTMTQPASLTLPHGSTQTGLLSLSGKQVTQGSGATAIRSTAAGFELTATSGTAPGCSAKIRTGCIAFPDERPADLKYVGITSDAPQLRANGQNPATDGLTYFAVSGRGPWRSAASTNQEYDISIDTNGDKKADFVTFNSRLPDAQGDGTDVLVAETINLATGAIADLEPIDDRFGDTDIDLFDSDTMVLPVAIGALGLGKDTRVNYGIASFSAYQDAPVDSIGVTSTGGLTGSLSFDPLHPGVAVYGSYDGSASPLLFRDSPGSVLIVRRDTAAYGKDRGLGALVVHFHNTDGNRAQRVALNTASGVSIRMTPNPARHDKKLSAVISVKNTSGAVPTGTVTFQRIRKNGQPARVATGSLKNGKITLSYLPGTVGSYSYRATYGGDANYLAGTSHTVTIRIK